MHLTFAQALPAMIVAGLLAIAGCTRTEMPAPHTADEGQPMMILASWHGVNGEREEAGFEVIRDEQAWEQAWEEAGETGEPPQVDFQQQMVLAAWMGQQRSGGFAIRITSIREADDAYEAVVERREPGADQIVTQALTAPYHFAVVPRTEKPVRDVAADAD